MSREFVIRITTDYSDAEAALRAAAEKIACELDWGGDATTSIEVTEQTDPPTYIAGWEMEPGDDEDDDGEEPTWREFAPGVDYGTLPVRSNGSNVEVGDPCSSCKAPLQWDDGERMVYCMNDWYHG